MGYYIDPESGSKEDFLREHGEPISAADARAFDFGGTHLPVCLVDNGAFTAAGIGYCPNEVEAFQQPQDHRPRRWFSVSRDDLKPFYSKG